MTVDIGAALHEVTSEDRPAKECEIGTVVAIDYENSTVDIKKKKATLDSHPQAVFSHRSVRIDPLLSLIHISEPTRPY